MMQAFRNSAKPVMIVLAITTFAWLVFSLSGISGGQGVLSKTSVGKIDGQSVDTRAYEAVVQRTVDQRQRQTPGGLSLEDMQQIRNEVWEQFIQNSVLNAEYTRRGITVREDEVVEGLRTSPPPDLMKVPEFQTDSQFDMHKYQRWLTSPASSQYVEAIAAQYREELRRSKLFRTVAADIYLSDAALWERYADQSETVRIGLTAILPRNAVPDSAVTVTPAEIAVYYKANSDEFKRNASAYLSFVALPRLTDASDTAAALARAKAVREEIVKGAPFAEVAKRESSDSVSASHGGELGEWKKGTFDPAFDATAFTLPINAVSEPVLSQFGYHIIQVESRKGVKAKGRHILIPVELVGAHRDRIDAQTDTLERLGAEKSTPAALDTVARALKLTIGRAAPLVEGGKVEIGRLVVPDGGVWAFEHKPGELSPVIETPIALYLFRLDSLHAAGVPPLAEIRPAVEQAVREEKKWGRARSIAQAYLARVRGGSSLPAASAEMKLPYKEFGPFSRVNPPLTTPAIVGAAFGLDKGQHSDVLDTKDGLYVIQQLDHTRPDSAAFVKQIDDLRAKAIQQARQERIRNFLSSLRASAKVVDDREQIRRSSRQSTPAGV